MPCRRSWCALSQSSTPGPGPREAERGDPAGAEEAEAWLLPDTNKVSDDALKLYLDLECGF